MTALHLLGDPIPVKERVLRRSFYDWRGRLPEAFHGLSFIYIGRSSEWPDHFEIQFWTGEALVPFVACADEVFMERGSA